MKCKIIKFIKIERKYLPPCFKIKAIGIRNEADMFICENDYNDYLFIDDLPPMFEKTLFPVTMKQAEELERRCKTDEYGNTIGEPTFIRLMSYQWITPFPYYIVNPKTATGVNEDIVKTTEEEKEYDDYKYILTKIRYIPKVYTTMHMTLFETKDGKCAENDGDADGVCKIAFKRAMSSGRFLSQKSASQIKEVTTYKEKYETYHNSCDDWNDYYNYNYYNDGLDMDQQDERFWNF